MIPHNRPTLGREEQEAARRVIASGYVAQGPEVEAFEDEFCDFLGLAHGHAVALSNGTSALFMALWAAGAQGKKVAFPGYVCSSLRHATAMVGGEEVLLDCRSDSPNVRLPRDASGFDIAIVPHMYGLPADWGEKPPFQVVEDCAQSLGASSGGAPTGVSGDIGIFSFYATKLMTSGGQGGMLVSPDDSLVAAVRDYREFDCRRDDRRRFNFQMTDLQAAVGREQLRKLPGFLSRREEIFERYRSAGLDMLDVPPGERGASAVRYRAVWQTDRPHQAIERLGEQGVGAIVPLEDWELLGTPELLPNAYGWTRRTVSLPIYPSLTEDEVERVVGAALNI